MDRFAGFAFALLLTASTWVSAAPSSPVVLTGADRRQAVSLDGDWATIVDPYFSGLFSFHQQERKDGYFLNRKAQPNDTFPTEYNFAKAPKLKVPGDWNTQRESLYFYEGPIWYERDFSWTLQKDHHVFLHIGAANYHSWFWVNGVKVCEHEGGYTAFNCEITTALKDGSNFVVAAVDNTRHEDGVPTLQTDWWNYGGLTRSVSLIDLPSSWVDQYDVHLSRTAESTLEGWVHLADAKPGSTVTVRVPELQAEVAAKTSEDGRAQFTLAIKNPCSGRLKIQSSIRCRSLLRRTA